MAKKKLPNVTPEYQNSANRISRLASYTPGPVLNISELDKYNYRLAPDNYDTIEWAKDAYTDWQVTRNKTNQDTAEGKLDRSKLDEDILDRSELYLIKMSQAEELKERLDSGQIDLAEYQSMIKPINNEIQQNDLQDAYKRLTTGDMGIMGEQIDVSLSEKSIDQQFERLKRYKEELAEFQNKAQEDYEYYKTRAEQTRKYWWTNTHQISDYYKSKQLATDFDFGNIDTYLYKLPNLLGSSASSMKSQVVGTVSAMVAANAPNPLVKLGAGLVSIASNMFSRMEESYAEVHQNYKDKVKKLAEKDKSINAAFKNASRQLAEQGITNADEDAILEALIRGKVKSGNEKFDSHLIEGLNGLESLYTDNMALSGWDVAQQAIEVMPFGSIAKSVSGTKALANKLKGVNKMINAGKGLKGKLADRIMDVAQFGVDNVKVIPKRNLLKNLTSIGGRVALTSIMEGAEEGTQYIRGQEYINDKFERNPSVFKSIVHDINSGARSVFAALTPWDPVYSSDKEFIENFKGGALLGGLTTSVVTPISQWRSISNQFRAEDLVSSIYADNIADKDLVSKTISYVKAAKSQNWQNIDDAFQQLKDSNIEGLDPEEIEKEAKRARAVRDLALSTGMQNEARRAGIDPRTDDYDIFVALRLRADDMYREKSQASSRIYDEITSITDGSTYSKFQDSYDVAKKVNDDESYVHFFSKLVTTKQEKNAIEELIAETEQLIDGLKRKGDKSQQLRDLERRLQFLELIHGIVSVQYTEGLKKTGVKDEQVYSPVDTELKDKYRELTLADVDEDFAFREKEVFDKGDSKAIKKKINKYKNVITEDEDTKQELQDLARGNVEQDTIVDDEPDTTYVTEEEKREEKKPELTEDGTKEETIEKPKPEPIQRTPKTQDNTQDETQDKTQDKTQDEVKTDKAVAEEAKQEEKPTTEDKTDTIEDSEKRKKKAEAHVDKLLNKLLHDFGEAKTIVDKLNIVYRMQYNINTLIEKYGYASVNDKVNQAIQNTLQEAESQGYEISELRGRRYNSGMRVEVQDFVERLELPIGEERIVSVIRPQILKDGVLFQAAKIVVGYHEDSKQLLKDMAEEMLKERSKNVKTTTKQTPKSRRQLELTRTRLNLNKIPNYDELTPRQRWIEAEQLAHEDNTYTNAELELQPDHIYTDNLFGQAYKLAESILEKIAARLAPSVAQDLMQQQEKLPQASRKNISWKYYDRNGNFNYQYNESFFYGDLDASDLDNYDADSWLDLKSMKDRLEEAIFDIDEQAAEELANQILDKVKEIESNENNLLQEEKKNIPTKQQQENKEKLDTTPTIEPEKPIADDSVDNIDVTYDRTIDPISHNLDYYTYNDNKAAREFAEVSANPDFITASEISINVDGEDIYIDFLYKGKKYTAKIRSVDDLQKDYYFRKKPFDAQTIIRTNLTNFRNKIMRLHQIASKNGGRIIPIGISRTNGRIQNRTQNGVPVNVNLQETSLWTLQDVYDITPDNTKIGISTGAIRNNAVRRGNEQWTGRGTSMGSAVWHVEITHPEDGTTRSIDIQLNNKPFKGNKEVADLILDLLLSRDQQYKTKDGVATPFTPQQLLNLIVNNGSHTIVQQNELNKLSPEQVAAKTAKQLAIMENGDIQIGSTLYTVNDLLTNPEIMKQASQYIQDNMHWNIDEDLLYKYFGGLNTTDSNHPLYNLKGWFKRTKADKLVIIPGELEFTRKDVGLDESAPNGISMVGWYIKNNIIQTDFDKLTDASIYMQDVAIEDPEVKKQVEEATTKVEEELAKPEDEQEITLDDIFKMLGPTDDAAANYTSDELLGQTKTIDIDSARAWLSENLGLTDEQVEVKDTILGLSRTDMQILGQSRIDSIVLSELAPEGVQYHEAWHRVSNLLISEEKRNKLYRRYRQKRNLKHTIPNTRIDEMMANDFMEFQLENRMKIDFETTNWFKKVLNFIRVWSKVGNYQLAKLYNQMNTGKFAKVNISQSNIDRFKRLYGNAGAPFEIRGHKFTHIATLKQYNDFLDSLTFLTIALNNIKEYSDIDKMDLNTVKRSLVNKDGTSRNPAWKELYDKFDSVVAKDLKQKLKNMQIKLVNKTRDDQMNSIDAGESNGVNIGEHTIASYETSAYENAPAEVKFFFHTIPAHKYTADGKKVLDMDAKIGIPRFVDPKITWNTVLNDLHEITSVQNMIDRINKLASENLLYSGVKAKIDSILAKTKSQDEKQATDAEVLLTKLYTVIRSHKHIFTTGKITQVENGNLIDIIDNTVDIKSKAYPAIWSQELFSSNSIFTHDEKGNVTFANNGKHAIDVILRNYKYVQDAFRNNGITKKGVNLKDPAAFETLKTFTAQLLNNAGILIDKGTIETIINRPEYGGVNDSQYDRLNKFYNTTALYGGMPSLMELLNSAKTQEKDGSINTFENNGKEIRPIEIYNSNGFVKEVAKAYVEYHANSEELRSLGAQGNLFYPISQNNFASDRVNELNTDLEVVSNLRKVLYNQGSRILEQLRDPKTHLELETFINFRTANSNDQGRDYFDITDKEDYISKMTMILNDRILFPTVADKKTYHTIRGIKLPHERLTFIQSKQMGQLVRFGDGVINQFMEYALAERDAIELCMRQVDDTVDENGNYVSKDRIEPSQRIKNYHTPNKYKDQNGKTHTIEPNGTRFRFLTGVYKYEQRMVDGKPVINKVFISFNDPKKSSAENLKVANDNFFGDHITDDQRRWMLDTLLQERVDAEIKKAVELGIITSVDDKNSTYGLRNSLLDIREVDSRSRYYAKNDRLSANAEGYAIYDMIADYTVNSIISINEIEQLFSGDPAYYKWAYDSNGVTDISIDKIKRLGALTSTGTNNRLDFDETFGSYTVAELKDYEVGSKTYDQIKELFIRGNVKSVVKQFFGEQALFDENGNQYTVDQLIEKYPEQYKWAQLAGEKQAGYDEGINVADAAVYVSPNMYRKMMRMIGEWSAEVEEAFEILTDPDRQDWESNPELYSKMLQASLKPLKYMAFGTRFNEITGLGIPYFNKMALFPLFKQVATGDMKALYDRMTDPNNPLDMVMFNSAVKAGSRSPIDYYTIDENGKQVINNMEKLVVYKQDFKYLRQQLNTDPHTHEEQMAGTQMLKVGLSNLGMNELYGNEGDQVTGETIKKTVFDCMNALSEKGRQQIYDELFDENGSVSIDKLGKILQEEAEGQDANDNIISGLQVKNGKFVIPISALSDNKWLESIFISYINKRTIDINLPGGAFIQRSTFGLEATQQSVISDNMLNNGKRLNLINDDGSMDSIVSINLLKHIIPGYHKMTFTEARQWLIDHDIIGDNAGAIAIGYRIPTQSQASISALRFTDVLPEIMGDTIVLPEEFTKLTGSDFDVDKLYVSRYAFEDGKRVEFDESKSYDENSQNQIKNKMIQMYLKVLTTLDNTNELKLSIDNDTEMVKDVLKDIESVKKSHHPKPFEVYSPTYQEDRKAEYTGGKAGIGPMALNNAHQILTQLMHTKMEITAFTRALQLVDLDRIYDYPTANGNNGRILSWLSAMINAFVDIAKDPYIVRLNVNPWTYNMTAFLLRTGKGRQTFYFLSQPILKEMANEVLKTRGKYGVDQTKTRFQLEEEAIQKVLDKYDPTGSIRKYYDGVMKDTEMQAIEFGDLFSTRMATDEITGESIETSRSRDLIVNPGDFSDYNKQQVRMYYAWKSLKPYADDMANLVKYSKIDTKRMGKSFAEQRVFDRGLQDMKKTSRFGEGEVDRFFNDSFLEVKRRNSIDLGQQIFHNLLIRNSDGFLSSQDMILKRLGRSNNASAEILNRVINAMEAYVKSGFFNKKMQEDGVTVEGMFYGENSMARRLLQITRDIYKGKYEDLLSPDGTISNGLLTFLVPNITNYNPEFNIPDFIDTSSMFDTDQLGQNNLINYWRELLEHPNETIRTFARDLIYYAFITSGDNTNMNSFFKYVPNSWRIESGYSAYMENQLDNYNGGSSDINYRDILLNNWFDDNLVKPVKPTIDIASKDENGMDTTVKASFIGIDADFIFPRTTKKPYAMFIGKVDGDTKNEGTIRPVGYYKTMEFDEQSGIMKKRSYPIFPPFVKIRMTKGNSPLSFAIYELVGYQEHNSKSGFIQYYPVYSLVNKKGLRYQGHVITELGRNDNYGFNFLPVYNGAEAIRTGKIKSDVWNSTPAPLRKKMYAEFANIKPIDQLKSYQDMENSDNYSDEPDFDDMDQSDNSTTQRTSRVDLASEWSRKEGWSVEYFNRKVLPKINEAWQMEYKLAEDQDAEAKLKGSMNFSYGDNKSPNVKSNTTLEAIRNGERTATTRYESDGNIEYWKQAKVGDIIEFHNKNGESVKVEVTKPITKLVNDATSEKTFNKKDEQQNKDDYSDEAYKACKGE